MLCLQVFDRSTFGVGALTTNRYQPPERVGDPLPSAVAAAAAATAAAATAAANGTAAGGSGAAGSAANGSSSAAAAAGGSSMRYSARGGARGGSNATAGASAAAGSGNAGLSQGFLPFSMPSYTIPAPTGRKGTSSAGLSQDSVVYTQAATQSMGRSQAPASQATTTAGAAGMYGGAADGAAGFGFTTDFASQATSQGGHFGPMGPYGTAGVDTSGFAGLDMLAGTGLGADALAGYGATAGFAGDDFTMGSQLDGFLLSQGFNETSFLDAATGEYYGTLPATQK